MYGAIQSRIEDFRSQLVYLRDLLNPDLRPRHWTMIASLFDSVISFDSNLALEEILALPLAEHADTISDISMSATAELRVEKGIEEIAEVWRGKALEFGPHMRRANSRIQEAEDIFQLLDDHITHISSFKSSPHAAPFEAELSSWEQKLSLLSDTLELLLNVQRSWMYFVSIFQLPDIKE